uniref:Uncharacterized protein n=1 Tax=Anguilla anguilla TaxID=7936 RepID=A0A0E9QPE0_ANGAN
MIAYFTDQLCSACCHSHIHGNCNYTNAHEGKNGARR